MIVEKRVLVDLPMVYAVARLSVNARPYYMAASELENGKCYLVDCETFEPFLVWDAPGGVMNLIPVEEEDGAFLAIEQFYPIFRSEKARIVKGTLRLENGTLSCQKSRVCDLPFAHRIGLAGRPGRRSLVACTLCGGKAFQEDWSVPGGAYVGDAGGELKQVLGGLTKNHGLFIRNEAGRDTVLISAHEGVFALGKNDGGWTAEKLLDEETSDLCLEDLDEDGEEELIAIQGFHGDALSVYKRENGSFRRAAELPIAFGHVLWAGELCGRKGIVVGNRGGDKELAVYWTGPDGKGGIRFEREVVDEGIGPAQISVCNRNGGTEILSANHGIGQLTLYRLRQNDTD